MPIAMLSLWTLLFQGNTSGSAGGLIIELPKPVTV
jgi:hypothetical protein